MSEKNTLSFTEVNKIGENDHGYTFGVGMLGGEWCGFAMGRIENDAGMIFLLPGCLQQDLPESLQDGGDAARDAIIVRVGAIAGSGEHGYGGIKRWFVKESLRGKSRDFMCAECGSVGCSPDAHDDDYDFYADEYGFQKGL